MINGCNVCERCGYGAAYARTRPQPNTKYSTGVYKPMEEAVCLMHNFLRLDNEAVAEDVVSKKRKRL